MYVADADDIAVAQLFVFDFLPVNKASPPAFVILQEQPTIVLYEARMAFIHRAGIQYQGVILGAPQRTDVLCDGKNRAAVVLETKLVHQILLAVLVWQICHHHRQCSVSAADYSAQTVKRHACLVVINKAAHWARIRAVQIGQSGNT